METLDPYRSSFGRERPVRLAGLPLPPAPMPGRRGGRPLKAWRYVGVFAEQAMVCAAQVRIGPLRQCFWAVWDRERGELRERTVLHGSPAVALPPGRLRISDRDVEADFSVAEEAGVETVCPNGAQYAWTRKLAGVPASGSLRLGDRVIALRGRAVIDDSAGYHARRTAWRWSAGVGTSLEGAVVGWNLVEGMNDPARASERTVWVDGVPREVEPVAFAADLSRVGDLRFASEATRRRRDNLLLLRSDYEQPFGTFSGTLPGGVELAEGLGVMERHEVLW